MSDERELRLALEHPRGTEQRRLGPFRAALNDPARYAALPQADRDAICGWAETRRRMALAGLDNDPSNLADPLIPAARLRAFVLQGERLAEGRDAAAGRSGHEAVDGDGDLIALVRRIRG